jgi:hypothetical protein
MTGVDAGGSAVILSSGITVLWECAETGKLAHGQTLLVVVSHPLVTSGVPGKPESGGTG